MVEYENLGNGYAKIILTEEEEDELYSTSDEDEELAEDLGYDSVEEMNKDFKYL